jgi:hypothetical protein
MDLLLGRWFRLHFTTSPKQWKVGLQIIPGMYFVWGDRTGGVKAAEIEISGHVIFYRYPKPVIYSNNNEFAFSENISHWYGPILNPYGGNT